MTPKQCSAKRPAGRLEASGFGCSVIGQWLLPKGCPAGTAGAFVAPRRSAEVCSFAAKQRRPLRQEFKVWAVAEIITCLHK